MLIMEDYHCLAECGYNSLYFHVVDCAEQIGYLWRGYISEYQ